MRGLHTLAPCITVALALSHHAGAAVLRDPAGDFDNSDVIGVETTVVAGSAVLTITYADEQIGMATGAGGTIGIDADQDPSTGAADTPGFDCRITFNVSQLAPMAEVEIIAGPRAGDTYGIGREHNNGTNLETDARWVRFTVPIGLVSAANDFDYVLFATGMFSAGGDWDRVPDQGIARASTGQARLEGPAGGQVDSHTVTAFADGDGPPLVRQVTTQLEGDNAVWIVETNENLPVGALDQYDSTYMSLMLDIDRSVATGINTGDVPLLPFGPDRVAECTLVPGGQGSIRIQTAIAPNGERRYVGGGAGVNDLAVTFERRRARIVIPLALIGAPGPQIDWMLFASKINQTPRPVGGSSIQFDTGLVNRPLTMPPNALVFADDPDDAVIIGGQSRDGTTTPPVRQPIIPNVELAGLQAALSQDWLMLRVGYQTPITLQARYFTSITLDAGARQYLLSVNWDGQLGGQVVLRDMSQGADSTQALFLNQCLATTGAGAHLLIPTHLFPTPLHTVQMAIETHEMGFDKPASQSSLTGITVTAAPRQNSGVIDRLPDQGTITLTAR